MNKSRLPPLSSIRAFEAAARHQSLRLAAEDLGVTPSAVSHHMKALEDWVGAALFVRVGREVCLTALGRDLAKHVHSAFDALAGAFARVRQDASATALRVSALPMFTQAWLLPRLGIFESAYPDIAIVIDTSSRLADFDRDAIDIAIRNGAKPSAKLMSQKLLDLKAVPLCTPQVASRLRRVEDLAAATLIHLSTGHEGWPEWLARSAAGTLKPRSNLTVDTMPAAIEAAAAGRGVMLGLHPIIWDMPSMQKLVVPFDRPYLSAGACYMVHRKADRMRRPVKVFSEWIVVEMRRDLTRLRRLPR